MEETRLEPVDYYRLTVGHDRNLKEVLLEWSRKRDVQLAWIQGIGELKNAGVAAGYHDDEDPDSDKFIESLDSNRHVLGMGTLIRDENGERVHLHGPMGRRNQTANGCWAGEPEVFRGMDLLVTVLRET